MPRISPPKPFAAILAMTFIMSLAGCWVSTNSFEPGVKGSGTYRKCVEACDEATAAVSSERSEGNKVDPNKIGVDRESFWAKAFFSWIPWLFYVAYYALGIFIGAYVYRDAAKRSSLALNIRPLWWAVMVFLQPPLGVLAYWVIHYSRFANKLDETIHEA